MFYVPASSETDASGNIINPAKEDGNLLSAKNDLDTLAGAVSAAKVNVNVTNASIATTSTPAFATRSDTFTTTGVGTTVDVHLTPITKFAIQVKGTGATATSWAVNIEGSLNGTQFSPIMTHVTATGDGGVLWTGTVSAPTLYFRSNCTAVSLGSATNIIVTLLGT